MVPNTTKNKVLLRNDWLEKWSQFRTTDWANYLEYPEFMLKQTQQLLSFLA